MDNDWDDLFAIASGVGTNNSSTVATSNSTYANDESTVKRDRIDVHVNSSPVHCRPESNSKGKKKGKKRFKKDNTSSGVASLLDQALASRYSDGASYALSAQWPAWLRPGASMVCEASSRRCRAYCPSSEPTTFNGLDTPVRCQNCHLSLLLHSLEIESSVSDSNEFLRVFAENRDARCCASHLIVSKKDHVREDESSLKVISHTIGSKSKSLSRSFTSCSNRLSPGESEILWQKLSAVVRAMEDLNESLTATKQRESGSMEHKSTPPPWFEAAVRVIIASDVFYYRLYYLQIINEIPIQKYCCDDGVNSLAFIPHPTTYFTAPQLCWDTRAGEKSAKYFWKRYGSQSDLRAAALLQYTRNPDDAIEKNDHPLSILRGNRFAETVLLFNDTNWTRSSRTVAQFEKATRPTVVAANGADDYYAAHETPAPHLLADWRNASRDLLCNLYAYATVAPDSIGDLCTLIERICNCRHLVELGAGTGYVAKILENAGMTVTALDIIPTRDTTSEGANANEYHGCTPPFVHVETGSVGALNEVFFRYTAKPPLLLCYPPPLSSMSFAALQSYLSCGGSVFVHIGEFQGLTGCQKFEELLITKFRCIKRWSCKNWGTDAAEVSVWQRAGANREDSSRATLIPCSLCLKKPSTKRFRLIRALTYCGQKCWESHESTRAVHFRANMIPYQLMSKVQFGDRFYFSNLS